jgi:hypothetical protein
MHSDCSHGRTAIGRTGVIPPMVTGPFSSSTDGGASTMQKNAKCRRSNPPERARRLAIRTASTECAGITVSSFGYPQNPKETPPDMSRPHWNLSINYRGDEPAQLWQMLPPQGIDLPLMQSKGTPLEIAKQVCIIIKGKGSALSFIDERFQGRSWRDGTTVVSWPAPLSEISSSPARTRVHAPCYRGLGRDSTLS